MGLQRQRQLWRPQDTRCLICMPRRRASYSSPPPPGTELYDYNYDCRLDHGHQLDCNWHFHYENDEHCD